MELDFMKQFAKARSQPRRLSLVVESVQFEDEADCDLGGLA